MELKAPVYTLAELKHLWGDYPEIGRHLDLSTQAVALWKKRDGGVIPDRWRLALHYEILTGAEKSKITRYRRRQAA